MSQDLLIPFIPNINYTQPMTKSGLTVSRVSKRPISNRDEESRTESEQMENLTYLDALKEKMRDAHQNRTIAYEFGDMEEGEEVEPSKSMLAEAIERVLSGQIEPKVAPAKSKKIHSTSTPEISPRKHLDVFA
ncbi:hypothetical protein DU002_08065 [Corallincola holothuriorum]|uniref:Uncharacterized protein n=1 Tax=Corallincola holothuriorum TaxID=2282215 RepID=A0A368NKH7_9GAMM|nr:hypothetical protein [Corallincola holothuriorum]RCU50373.1 hypothetical protein DU002_08065 [Corallincola holothuriorum]